MTDDAAWMVTTMGRRAGDGSGAAKTYANGSAPTTMKPLTVKMLKRAVDARQSVDDMIVVNGAPVQNLTVVGKIVGVEKKSSVVVYKVDDSTGTCDVKVWIDQDGDEAVEPIEVGAYVRVYGSLKTLANEHMIAAHTQQAVRKITDHNEVTFHMLEVVYASGHAEKNKTSGGVAPMNAYTVPREAPNVAAHGDVGSEDIQVSVMGVLKQFADSEQGMTVADIMEKQNGKFTAEAIKSALEDMSNGGEVFTTIDEDHYQAV
jgi:replication factor A2